MSKNFQKSRTIKPGWFILIFLVIFFLFRFFFSSNSFDFHEEVVLSEGDTIHTIYDRYMTNTDSRKVRLYLKTHQDKIPVLQPGKYIFSGTYSPADFVEELSKGPTLEYETVRLLEGWSIYDIDDYLVSQNLAEKGDYISYVSDQNSINSIASKYDFVQKFIETKPSPGPIENLEGLLYPDTYKIDLSKNVVYQLVALQLQAFQQKVYVPYRSQIDLFSEKLESSGYSFHVNRYNIVTLASIVEKEENNIKNMPVIAGIFLNRIQNNMRIDADITLCYGLKKSYNSCTPKVIIAELKNTSNLYNTRVHSGLTPGPIANPSKDTFHAVLNFISSNYFYYLHDASGQIHYGETLEKHNQNKKHL